MRQTIPETCLPNICACGTRADLPWRARPGSRALHMFAAVTKFVAVRGTCIAIHSCGERSKAKQKVATGDGGGSESKGSARSQDTSVLARADACTQGMLTSDSFASKPKCRRGREYLPSLRHLVLYLYVYRARLLIWTKSSSRVKRPAAKVSIWASR